MNVNGVERDSVMLAIVLSILVLALLLALLRLILGPGLANRVVALNLMSTIAVGIIAAYAILADEPLFLDVASILALISFLGTVAFARYIELTRKSSS